MERAGADTARTGVGVSHNLGTQNCPLFLPGPRKLRRPATTPIPVIVGRTACWRAWGYWRMQRHCLVLPPQFRGREFCWPCLSWSPAAYSSVRKKSMARWGRPFMDCALACSRFCSWHRGVSNGRRASRSIHHHDLGRVLGLDRAPEVKTLRRKLARLAAVGHEVQFWSGPGPTTSRPARKSPGLRRRFQSIQAS
jgi:hypothetical protein